MTERHLWEIDHPYYCHEGNFFVPGTRYDEVHNEYGSWAEFYAAWGDSDEDMNLVFRWDWKRDSGEYLEEGEEAEPDKLWVYWVLQRKAILRSTECVVTEADEPAVRAWLAERAKTITAIWEPITLVHREEAEQCDECESTGYNCRAHREGAGS
jgi:hypothetical protein